MAGNGVRTTLLGTATQVDELVGNLEGTSKRIAIRDLVSHILAHFRRATVAALLADAVFSYSAGEG